MYFTEYMPLFTLLHSFESCGGPVDLISGSIVKNFIAKTSYIKRTQSKLLLNQELAI